MVFPSPVTVKVATSIQPLEITVVFVKQGPRRTVVFVSWSIMIYPRIRPFERSDRGSHWTVTDDEPSLVAEDFGGGRRVVARRKSMDTTFQPFRYVASLTGRKFSLDKS